MYKVIIAEDEVFVRMGYKTVIRWQELGMEVVADVANGREALEAYQRTQPDIILTDLRMPVMDGLALIRAIRATDARTRFLIITCLEEFDKAREALELGVSGYVLKLDANVEDLERKLSAICKELDQMSKPILTPDDGEMPDKVVDALAYIEESHTENISLSDVAQHIGVTPNYLSRLFALHLETSFTHTLNRARVAHAKRLFDEGAGSVHEVGRTVGFTNDTYFIRVFKKQEGITPNEYRVARRRTRTEEEKRG